VPGFPLARERTECEASAVDFKLKLSRSRGADLTFPMLLDPGLALPRAPQ
jgi:hypothetical protein